MHENCVFGVFRGPVWPFSCFFRLLGPRRGCGVRGSHHGWVRLLFPPDASGVSFIDDPLLFLAQEFGGSRFSGVRVSASVPRKSGHTARVGRGVSVRLVRSVPRLVREFFRWPDLCRAFERSPVPWCCGSIAAKTRRRRGAVVRRP